MGTWLESIFWRKYVDNIGQANDWEEELYHLTDYVNNVYENTDIKIPQQRIQKEIWDILWYYNDKSAWNIDLWLDQIEMKLRDIWSKILLEPVHVSTLFFDLIYDEEYCNTKAWKEILELINRKDELLAISLPEQLLIRNPDKKNELTYILETIVSNNTANDIVDYRKLEKLKKYTWFLIPRQESIRIDKKVKKYLNIDNIEDPNNKDSE